MLSDAELYRRGIETALASWGAYARGANGASVRRSPGLAAAVFPHDPERGIYNNAILERGLANGERAPAVAAMEAAYADADITRFAVWVHESDPAMGAELERRGYAVAETTRAMGLELADVRLRRPELELGSPDWDEYLSTFELPPGLLAGADHSALHVLVARLDGHNAATAMAYYHRDDCGIYNVATVEPARRRGLATSVTALHLHYARASGCVTATLQATGMAERLYATLGFRDLGRILEYAR